MHYNLTAHKGEEGQEKILPRITVSDHKDLHIATVWADGGITPVVPNDFTLSEIKFFVMVAENFQSFYYSLIGKDEELRQQYKLLGICDR